MLAQERLDGVVIAVWHAAHYEAARACLEQGLHVVLEKPMTLLAAHARHLTELSRARGCQLIIGYPWNYNPHVLRVKEVIGSGQLGGIRYINNMFASSVISLYRGDDSVHDNLYQYPVTGPGDVYSDPERSGGGQGHLQATHSVGLMLHMTGLRPVSVLALMDNLDTRVDVVDAMIAQMDNGALANVGSTGTLHAGGPEQEMVVQIYCDRGWINADIIHKSCAIYYADGSVEEVAGRDGGAELSVVGAGEQPCRRYRARRAEPVAGGGRLAHGGASGCCVPVGCRWGAPGADQFTVWGCNGDPVSLQIRKSYSPKRRFFDRASQLERRSLVYSQDNKEALGLS